MLNLTYWWMQMALDRLSWNSEYIKKSQTKCVCVILLEIPSLISAVLYLWSTKNVVQLIWYTLSLGRPLHLPQLLVDQDCTVSQCIKFSFRVVDRTIPNSISHLSSPSYKWSSRTRAIQAVLSFVLWLLHKIFLDKFIINITMMCCLMGGNIY